MSFEFTCIPSSCSINVLLLSDITVGPHTLQHVSLVLLFLYVIWEHEGSMDIVFWYNARWM